MQLTLSYYVVLHSLCLMWLSGSFFVVITASCASVCVVCAAMCVVCVCVHVFVYVCACMLACVCVMYMCLRVYLCMCESLIHAIVGVCLEVCTGVPGGKKRFVWTMVEM